MSILMLLSALCIAIILYLILDSLSVMIKDVIKNMVTTEKIIFNNIAYKTPMNKIRFKKSLLAIKGESITEIFDLLNQHVEGAHFKYIKRSLIYKEKQD